jgi:acyl carrier protein
MNESQLIETEKQQVTDILIEQLGVEKSQLLPAADLKRDLRADSLTVMEIVLALEEAFHTEIPDTAWEGVSTVQQVYDTMAEHLRKVTSPAK